MARKRRSEEPKPVYSQIGVKVDRFEASLEADINVDAKDPRYAIDFDERDPIYKFITRLTITGAITFPADRAGHRIEITVYDDDSPSRRMSATLKDLQERGEYGQPVYRKYRDRTLPVLRKPSGLALLDKVRGESAWTSWANLSPRIVSDMLVLLSSDRQLFVAIYERKVGRARWIDSLSLQTIDPADQ